MTYRTLQAIPRSQLDPARQGEVLARFCRVCESFYPPLRRRHLGRPVLGKDLVSAPCAHEGELFVPGADWWEEAVAILPPPPAEEAPEAAGA
ncbi:MAG TPA: hypothetical protein PKX99_05560 [Thermoanaerobaculia bacterium]|nr:hypothetical protein [Thermoanaerobaculia bacterium]